MNDFFKNNKHHFIAIGIFLVVSVLFCSPVLEGKRIFASDNASVVAMQKEGQDYHDKTGKIAMWSNRMFSGMPILVGNVFMRNFLSQVPYFIGKKLMSNSFSWDVMFYHMLMFYILMVALGMGQWASILGAFAFAFTSFNIGSLEGGHYMKLLAIGTVPAVLAGLVYLTKKQYYLGISIFLLSFIVLLGINHTQITYYAVLIIGVYSLVQAVLLIKEKAFKQLGLTAGILVLAVGLAAVANYELLNFYISAKETIRGGVSELAEPGQQKAGLDKDYAYRWSNTPTETINFIIPNFTGGSSQNYLVQDKESATLKALQSSRDPNANQLAQQTGAYWGDQPFVSGGNYFGVIIMVLALLGMLIIKDRMKWVFFGIMMLFYLLSLGSSFSLVSDFFFDFVPGYNKFRVPSMCLSMVQIFSSILAAWGFQTFITSADLDNQEKRKKLFISFGIIAGIIGLLYVMGASMFSFNRPDANQLPTWLTAAMKEDRVALMQSDALRSLLFVALAFAALFAYLKGIIKPKIILPLMAFLALADMWQIDKRFLNAEDFMSAEEKANVFTPDAVTQQILNSGDLYSRVYNLVGMNPFNDALTSYYLNSIGGYHPAKLRRYQELIENQIAKNNQAVLNMLNTKYFIGQDNKGQKGVQLNPGALGNAWFVSDLKVVENGKQEMDALNNNDSSGFNPAVTAVIQSKWADAIQGKTFAFDSVSTIKLREISVHNQIYDLNMLNDQLAVFSHIFYQLSDGDGWKAYIDGQEVPVMKADYVLRSVFIPKGAQVIEFKYDSNHYDARQRISFFGTLLACIIAIFLLFRLSKKGEELDKYV